MLRILPTSSYRLGIASRICKHVLSQQLLLLLLKWGGGSVSAAYPDHVTDLEAVRLTLVGGGALSGCLNKMIGDRVAPVRCQRTVHTWLRSFLFIGLISSSSRNTACQSTALRVLRSATSSSISAVLMEWVVVATAGITPLWLLSFPRIT